jgi:hypothetical protein
VSKISLAPDASGTGIFTIASPGTSTNRTLTLPDDTEQLGVYVKVGQLVFCSIVVTFTNKGTSTGSVNITGLPFTVLNNAGSRGGGQWTYVNNGASITGSPTVQASSNTTSCECFQSGTSQSRLALLCYL